VNVFLRDGNQGLTGPGQHQWPRNRAQLSSLVRTDRSPALTGRQEEWQGLPGRLAAVTHPTAAWARLGQRTIARAYGRLIPQKPFQPGGSKMTTTTNRAWPRISPGVRADTRAGQSDRVSYESLWVREAKPTSRFGGRLTGGSRSTHRKGTTGHRALPPPPPGQRTSAAGQYRLSRLSTSDIDATPTRRIKETLGVDVDTARCSRMGEAGSRRCSGSANPGPGTRCWSWSS